MNILVLNYEYPPIGGGGGQVSKHIAEEMIKRSHRVTVITSHFRNIPRTEIINGVHIRRMQCFRNKKNEATIFSMGLFILLTIIPTIRLTKKIKPDIIHCHFGFPTGVVAIIVAKITRIPYILTLHGGDVPGFLQNERSLLYPLLMKRMRPLMHRIWKNAKKVTTVSPNLKALINNSLPSLHVEVIPNGIPIPDTTQTARIKNGLINKRSPQLRFIAAGRLATQKGFQRIIPIIQELSTKRENFHCSIIGDGPLQKEIQQLIEEKNLQQFCTLEPWMQHTMLLDRIASAHILVVSSYQETTPIIALEALAHGTPVLSSHLPSLKPILQQNNNGWFANFDQPSEVVNILEKLDTNTIISMSQRCIQSTEKFAWPIISAQYEKMYSNIIIAIHHQYML